MYMQQYILCKACNGVKRTVGLGMISKECLVCDGLGKIKAPVAAIEPKAVVPKARAKQGNSDGNSEKEA